MEAIFRERRPQLVFHAAAYKHLQLMRLCVGGYSNKRVGNGQYNRLVREVQRKPYGYDLRIGRIIRKTVWSTASGYRSICTVVQPESMA